MYDQIRNLMCFTNLRNTGRRGCKYDPRFAKLHILVPAAWYMDVTPVMTDEVISADLIAAIIAGLNDDDETTRFQIIGPYTGFEDKSEAPTMQKKGYGSSTKINDGTYIHEYTHSNGIGYHNSLRSYDGRHGEYKVLSIDASGVITGSNGTGGGPTTPAIRGLELSNLNVFPYKAANFETEAEYRIGFTFAEPKEFNENGFAVATGDTKLVSKFEAAAVVDTVLLNTGSSATRTFEFRITTANGGVNLYDTYGATLADTTLFVAARQSNGAAITITSITANAITKDYSFLFAVGGGYSATAKAVLKMAAVSVLAAEDIEFYASDDVVFVMN